MAREHDQERLSSSLHDAYQDVVPTPAQRQRHLASIAGTLPGTTPVPWRRRQGLLEVAVVVAVLAVVVGAFALWESRTVERTTTATPVSVVGAPVASPETAGSPTGSTCPETPPDPDVSTRHAADPINKDWYGNGDLVISPVSIQGVNPSVPESDYRWFSGGMPVVGEWPFKEGDVFSITAGRLDGPADLVSATQTNDAMINSIVVSFPESGCWELTASVQDMSLTIVVDVRPQAERPDVLQASQRHDEQQPYPVPESCGSGWDGPVDRYGNYAAAYWIDRDGISVRSGDGLLWTNEPNMLVWIPDEWGEITVEGHALDGGMALGYASDFNHRVGNYEGDYWQSSLRFGAPGCWELTATIGELTTTFNVWVYPAECRREPGATLPANCRRPD